MSSHITEEGHPHMVDISPKAPSERVAVARGIVTIPASIPDMQNGEWWSRKGPVFQTAIVAGIQGAKHASTTIPLCHPLSLTACTVDIQPLEHTKGSETTALEVICTARTTGATGVEMEALAGVSAACLTVYDMGKSLTHGIEISGIVLLEKTGGKSDWDRTQPASHTHGAAHEPSL